MTKLNALAVVAALCAADPSHVTQAAEPAGTLTLACEGTGINRRQADAKPAPVSMSITIELGAQTVHGFGSSDEYSGTIILMDPMILSFEGFNKTADLYVRIDRMTGALHATWTEEPETQAEYSLQCKTAQRMFDAKTSDESEPADIIREYEFGKGDYIELTPEEYEAIAMESKRTIDIDEFVPKDEIDELHLIPPR
jgi:hypothetical protein